DAHGARSHGRHLPLVLRVVRRVPVWTEPASSALHAVRRLAAHCDPVAYASADGGHADARSGCVDRPHALDRPAARRAAVPVLPASAGTVLGSAGARPG